ncbi:LexA family protein [Phyllobacterium chamaecytisi]|uniref:LexA family protein n=1 Tax=Phyllobacterium chamaecytisi TaxID=2876082 RepID=UPI001CCB5113|nr:XRE family transcriptional regulator [Phyllobacterium sp. KW56]MBZ9600712.1 XRE family transcriptional regulator [Phyllobacterium sp. KW56]
MDVIFPKSMIDAMDSSLQKRVRQRMDHLGLNALQAAKAAGLGASFVRDILRGKTKSPSAENLAKLAEALKTSTEFLLGANDDNVETVEIPVVGLPVISEINAGTWLEVTVFEGEQEPHHIPVARDPRFPRARQYALLVRGDSMDLEYPDGTYVTCVDYWDAGVEIASGMRVHVERRMGGGQFVEITVKAIERTGEQFFLVPKSSNDKWQPIPIDGDETTEVIIKGVVTGGYRPTPIPGK